MKTTTIQHEGYVEIIIDPGRSVVCDDCNKDWTENIEVGGLLFGSKAICPDCAPKWEKAAVQFDEAHFIKARCPANLSFANWVRDHLRSPA